MKKIEDCWGEKLSHFLVKPNTDYFPPQNEHLADEVFFVFEKSKIHILPLPDTDELSVECLEYDNTKGSGPEGMVTIVNNYIGKSLSMTWNCFNANGYLDLFAIGFDQLHPNLMILSEGSVLKLFDVMQIKK